MWLLAVFGCAEPIPTNQSIGGSQQPPSMSRNPAVKPLQGEDVPPEEGSGCRSTQYWLSSVDPDNMIQMSGLLKGDGTTKQYLIDVISIENPDWTDQN